MQLANYQVEEKIADGGMAEVFLATRRGAKGWQKSVVLKKILPPLADQQHFREMFRSEAEHMTKLCHPNIVSIVDFQEHDDELYLIEEYVQGVHLRELVLRNRDKINWQHLAIISMQLLDALCYLHSPKVNILHRDLCPQNVVISDCGYVKLIDFGIARQGDQDENAKRFQGKRRYLPPEYLLHQRYDKKSESFAFAKTMLEMLKKTSLIAGYRNFHALLKRCSAEHSSERCGDLSEISKDLQALVRSLNLDVRQLVSDIGQFVCVAGQCRQSQHVTALQHTQYLTRYAKKRQAAPLMLSLLLLLFPISTIKESEPVLLASNAMVSIDSFPWSSVYIDGKFRGVTPFKAGSIGPGIYRVELLAANGQHAQSELQLYSGDRRELFVNFE